MHQIGMNYRDIIKTRKNRHSLPPIGRLRKTIDLDSARTQIMHLIAENEEKISQGLLEMDPSSTEHTYDLKNKQGNDFIKNYDEVYKRYSVIGFHELTDEAKTLGNSMTKKVSDFTPVQRLKGMVDTSSEYYHPFYDERNYTKPTVYNAGYINEFLGSFQSNSCRAAVVSLYPGRFITKHFDIGAEYITRLQIPIITNPGSVIGVKTAGGWNEYHLPADGGIFFINAGIEHYAINRGDEIRYQIRVCLESQEDLEDIQPHDPVRFVSDADFEHHPCSGNDQSYTNITKETLNEIYLEKSGHARLD
jgi:hypothetical protein